MKAKSQGFWLKLIGDPYEKGWKIMKKASCVYEGGYAHMKAKNTGF